MKLLSRIIGLGAIVLPMLWACSGSASRSANDTIADDEQSSVASPFSADSAYAFISKQVEFGPRVPNTAAHRAAGDWLVSKLKGYGADVMEQTATLTAFDGTRLNARNIFAQYNPEASDRILLLAHWDCRPWADKDPDPAKRRLAVDGANDGASGVGVLLEIARQISLSPTKRGIDILLVDAEDWGTDGDEDSWALGTRHFVDNPPVKGYAPSGAILLDMVGGKDARFPREYFSEKNAPALNAALWGTADRLGYAALFPAEVESAVTDDHIRLIEAGIPAVDIIEYHPQTGFNSRWHTTSDNMDGISKETLEGVGRTVATYLGIGE